MERLTHKRENGIKRGYWSPNKKQELVDRLAMYEDREENDDFGKWILCSERFHRKPYQSYTVDDYLKKMGVDVTKGVDAGGQERSD